MADTKITALTANTTPAVTDILPMVDDPAGSPLTQKITFQNFLKVINGLTEDASPVTSADFLLSYDTSASDVKKVKPDNLGFISTSSTSTLTNKRITPRVTSITSSATPTINTDNCDAVTITALAAAITSMTTNLSGTPTNFQKLIIRIKDNGTARAITWGASFEAKGVALPTTTTISKVLTVGFLWDSVTSKWGCIAAVNEV